MSVSGSIAAQVNDFSASLRRQAPEAAVTREPRRAGDAGPVRSSRPPQAADPVSLPKPGDRTERDERTERPVEGPRFRRLVGKGLRRLTRGVRKELRQLSREFDVDRDTRKEIRQSYKEFRTELRDAFKATRGDRSIDGQDFASTIRNAFLGLAQDIRTIFEANAGQDNEPAVTDTAVDTPPVVAQPEVPENETPVAANPGEPGEEIAPTEDPAAPVIFRAVAFVSTFQSVYSRVDQGEGGRSESTYSYSQTQFRFEFEVRGSQLENVA